MILSDQRTEPVATFKTEKGDTVNIYENSPYNTENHLLFTGCYSNANRLGIGLNALVTQHSESLAMYYFVDRW